MDYYLGVGPAAVSTLPSGTSLADPWKRIINPLSIHGYLDFAENGYQYSAEQVEILSWDELLFEHLMMGLRLLKGIPVENVYRRFPREYHHGIDKILQFVSPYTHRIADRIALTDNYFDIQNEILSRVFSTLNEDDF